MKRLKNPSRHFLSDVSRPSAMTLGALLLGFVGIGVGLVVYTNAAVGPSGVAIPADNVSGWHQVFADDFNTTGVDSHWNLYNGKYGGGVPHYASNTHVYNANGTMHLLGKLDASSYNGTQWYTGGACLCTGSESWIQTNDVKVSYRWRVTNTSLATSYDPKYAFLRWPKSEVWPQDGEEDFQEGSLGTNAGAGLFMHHASSTGADVNSPQTSYSYDPSQWHTVTYTRQGYHVNLVVDGATKFDYTGTATDLPTTIKHIVFQQECNYSGCPTAGTSDVEFDWVAVYVPGNPTASATPTVMPTATPMPTSKVSQFNNIANGKTFVASNGANTYFPVSQLNDKNEATRWTSATQNDANSTVTTDLGAYYSLNKVSILWAGDTTKNYQLQVSSDNTTWKTVATGTTNNTTPQLIDHTSFSATPYGRYFRIVNNDLWNTAYGNSIWEIGLYGTSAAPSTPAPTVTPVPTATPAPTADATAPTFTSVVPANGSSYKRTVTLSAAASDTSGVASMTIQVDGKTLAMAQSDYISINWNSGNNRASSGAHTVTFTATDAKGNIATTTRTIYIK